MAITLTHPALMKWNSNPITDHSRSPLQVSTERIEKKQRMWNGTMRKYVVAVKQTWQVSWDMLPKPGEKTVDGFWGAGDIENFVSSTPGVFTLELTDADGTVHSYQAMFSDFSKQIEKRGAYDFWQVSVSMEEV